MKSEISTLMLLLALLTVGCGDFDGTSDRADKTPEQQFPVIPAPDAGPAPMLPAGVTAEMVEQGREIYAGPGICFTCHAPDGSGTGIGPALNDQRWIHLRTGSYDEIVNIIRTGVTQPREHQTPMPPMGGANLNEEQLRAVAAYVYTLSQG